MLRYIIVAVVLSADCAFGLTGIGLGVHAGRLSNFDYEPLADSLERAAALFGWEKSTLDDDMTTIGVHLDVGTFQVIEITGNVDYTWKKTELSPDVDFRLSVFSYGAGVRKKFLQSIIKPFIGAGVGIHRLASSFESSYSPADRITVIAMIPENQSKIGYYVAAGLSLEIPMLPLKPYGEYRYNMINTRDESTKFGTLIIGVTLGM